MKENTPLKINYHIKSFMLEQLQLGGVELLVFAIIHSFTRGEGRLYYGSQDFLARAVGMSVSTVKRVLQRLIEKEYIEKCCISDRSGYRSTEYCASVEDGEYSIVAEDTDDDEEDDTYVIEDKEIIDNLGEMDKAFLAVYHPKYTYHSFLRYGVVCMTAQQYRALRKIIDKDRLDDYMRHLEHLIMNGSFKTHSAYKTIKRWALEDAKL